MKWMLDGTYYELPVIHIKKHHGHHQFRMMPDGTIIKTINWKCKNAIQKLIKMNPPEHVIYPKQAFRIMHSDLLTYTQDYKEDMAPLYAFSEIEKNYSDKEILEFFKSMLITLSKIHNSGVISGDITYANIIMNEELDYNFIDFELAYVKNVRGLIASCATCEIPYLCFFDEVMLRSIYSEKDMFQYFDKANLINMMLYAISYGMIPSERLLPLFNNFEKLGLENNVKDEFKKFLAWDEKTEYSNYLIDVVNHLIEHDYHLPYRKIK